MILAVLAGMALPLQASLNTKLGQVLQHPVAAAFVSFLVGTIALFMYLLFSGWRPSSIKELQQAPVSIWTGGLLGAYYVSMIVIFVPRLGVALTFGLIIGGQMLLSVLMDHFGWMGLPVHPISAGRLAGIVLLIVGVVLIRKF